MKVSYERTHFLKQSVEYLGFIVTNGGAKTDAEKVKAIREHPKPSNLHELRVFLGLSSYYLCFVEDFDKQGL